MYHIKLEDLKKVRPHLKLYDSDDNLIFYFPFSEDKRCTVEVKEWIALRVVNSLNKDKVIITTSTSEILTYLTKYFDEAEQVFYPTTVSFIMD